jgi:hypothetical protein
MRPAPGLPSRGKSYFLTVSLGPSPARREQLTGRIRRLTAATITCNLIEAATAITAGTLASSTALTGFGLDSVVEVTSAAAVAWQFSASRPAVRETREKTTLRVTAVSFFALAALLPGPGRQLGRGRRTSRPHPRNAASAR